MVYLFIGQDSPAKDAKIATLRHELFPSKDSEDFNFDIIYADELDLKKLQEVLFRLPLKAKQRMVWLRKCQKLKENIKDYLTGYVKNPLKHVTLVLDMERFDRRDGFQNEIGRSSSVARFQDKQSVNAFTLGDEIDRRSAKSSLNILQQLLADGAKPETIMGALRYGWEKSSLPVSEKKRRFKFLLNCDIDIKTGRLKPAFALERLIISLCCSTPPKVKLLG
ncbi:MAG: hypothetical protein WC486_01775 [Candidatus Omnitrophota bacterium]|jgi:DNA polymerase III delta subunit